MTEELKETQTRPEICSYCSDRMGTQYEPNWIWDEGEQAFICGYCGTIYHE